VQLGLPLPGHHEVVRVVWRSHVHVLGFVFARVIRRNEDRKSIAPITLNALVSLRN
jgi:hypothetical protein